MDNRNYFKQKKFEMASTLFGKNYFPYECYNGYHIYHPLRYHDNVGNLHQSQGSTFNLKNYLCDHWAISREYILPKMGIFIKIRVKF